MGNNSIPELLAPAGGFTQLRAAVQNGADAVYMGGPFFNARIKADNFTCDNLKRAVEYAHERNVKVYITLNTLIKDSELSKAFSYVNFLYGIGVDAIILQDMGISRLIRKYLPDMPMHLSTQATVYNEWAAETVKKLGFCRVVPARELSMEEIVSLTKACHGGESSCQVEVFVHGALCMCYSGQCQMSRVLGGINGRSGNRGLCAQPCRLPYSYDSGEKGYFLSPGDICMLEHIPELCRAGVDSFKIEGRLKSPQYVAVVTSVYRKYLDMYRDKGRVEVSEKDMKELRQIFNRGGFSGGYLLGNPGGRLLSGESPKNMGVYIGSVKEPQRGAKRGKATLIDIECKGELSIGDGIEIRGKSQTGNVVTYLKEISKNRLRVGDIKERVYTGDKVYKVTDKALLKTAEASYEKDNLRKSCIDVKFSAVIGKVPRLVLVEKTTGITVEIAGEKETDAAVNKATGQSRVCRQLTKLGETPFEADKIEVKLEENAAIPVSVINTMRRQAVERLLEIKRKNKRTPLAEKAVKAVEENERLGENIEDVFDFEARRKKCRVYNRNQLSALKGKTAGGEYTVYIPVELYMEMGSKEAESFFTSKAFSGKIDVMPYILNVSKGKLDSYIEENFTEIAEAVKYSGILIGNLGWIERFRRAGIKVFGDYGLNIYNVQGVKAMEEIGVEVKELSHEISRRVEEIPLMITEHEIPSKFLTDRKGERYSVVKSESGDKWLIFSVKKR